MTIGHFGNEIRKHFNANPDRFLWKPGLFAFKRIMIDMEYLDEWLQQQPGYDPDESIKENVTRMYGDEASRFVESAM